MSDFFDLCATHNPHRWFLPISPDLVVGHGEHLFMFGGVGLAAGVTALERTCGRPVVWATAQYLSFARPGSVLDLDVWTPAEGRTVTQARVVGHVGDKEVITVNAALGARPGSPEGQWPRRPEAPPPQDCRPVGHDPGEHLGLHERMDLRIAAGRYRSERPMEGVSLDGRMTLWARPRGDHPMNAGLLAVIADYLASGVPGALGGPMGVNSLDNTIRFGAIEPSEWVLCDVRIELIDAGFAHGTMYMFADSGRLMAIASQTMVLRGPPPQGRA